jgi:glutamine synthetase
MTHAREQIQKVDERILSKGIKFINLQFTDIMGVVKSVGIPVEMWPDVLDHGLWFDGSSVQGFARIAESDMLLHPDLDTFAVIPWDTDVPTARVICDAHLPTGEPFTGDPRNVLKRALADAASMGYEYFTGPELEFFLFKPHTDGSLTPLVAHDQAGYFDVSTDLAHSVRRQMVMALNAFDITVEALHHEVAVGQHEIDFKYDNALRTADNAVTLRLTLKAIAQRNGLYATFMPKPVAGINGSGMHTHQSLWSEGRAPRTPLSRPQRQPLPGFCGDAGGRAGRDEEQRACARPERGKPVSPGRGRVSETQRHAGLARRGDCRVGEERAGARDPGRSRV